jgi:hypothetical protein
MNAAALRNVTAVFSQVLGVYSVFFARLEVPWLLGSNLELRGTNVVWKEERAPKTLFVDVLSFLI